MEGSGGVSFCTLSHDMHENQTGRKWNIGKGQSKRKKGGGLF